VLAVAAKELQPRILDFVHAKDVIQRLNDVQDAASHRAVIRVYDDACKGGRPLVAPNIERRAIPVPDAHSCVLGAPF